MKGEGFAIVNSPRKVFRTYEWHVVPAGNVVLVILLASLLPPLRVVIFSLDFSCKDITSDLACANVQPALGVALVVGTRGLQYEGTCM